MLVIVGTLGNVGAAGVMVSMVRVWVTLEETPPSASVALAVTVLVPFTFRAKIPEVGVAVFRFTAQTPAATVVV
jgi:putative flippase GtrA